METTIGAFEAKTHFSELIERAAQGHETLITRRGKPIAKITPIDQSLNVDVAQKAALRLRTLAKSIQIQGWSEEAWKSDRDEGRA